MVESHGRYRGQLMALGIAPGPKSVRGRQLSCLPLLCGRRFQEWYWSDRQVQTRIIEELKRTIEQQAAQLNASWWTRLCRWAKGVTK